MGEPARGLEFSAFRVAERRLLIKTQLAGGAVNVMRSSAADADIVPPSITGRFHEWGYTGHRSRSQHPVGRWPGEGWSILLPC
jgi:hypothetical protein